MKFLCPFLLIFLISSCSSPEHSISESFNEISSGFVFDVNFNNGAKVKLKDGPAYDIEGHESWGFGGGYQWLNSRFFWLDTTFRYGRIKTTPVPEFQFERKYRTISLEGTFALRLLPVPMPLIYGSREGEAWWTWIAIGPYFRYGNTRIKPYSVSNSTTSKIYSIGLAFYSSDKSGTGALGTIGRQVQEFRILNQKVRISSTVLNIVYKF